MVSISALFVSLAAIVTAASLASREPGGPGHHQLEKRQSQGGFRFYFQNWSDGVAKVNCRNGSGGAYNVSWSGDKGNFVCGKGYFDVGTRNVSYEGTIQSDGNAYVALYGWTRNPLVEWYVVEWYGAHKPCTGNDTTIQWLGNVTSDGDEYEICTKMRIEKPSIDGTATFPQFWSVRRTHRTAGSITTRAHFEAWTQAGLELGKQQYMVLAVEGQDSNGTAAFTVETPPAQTASPL